jgi:glutaredoxin-like YruB-family protein
MTEKKGADKKTAREVVIYSTPNCPICKRAKNYFKKKEIPFKDIDVAADQEEAHKMIHLSGQLSVPVITVGDEVMVGFNQVEFDKMMARK